VEIPTVTHHHKEVSMTETDKKLYLVIDVFPLLLYYFTLGINKMYLHT